MTILQLLSNGIKGLQPIPRLIPQPALRREAPVATTTTANPQVALKILSTPQERKTIGKFIFSLQKS